MFCWVSLSNGISTFVGYLMLNQSLACLLWVLLLLNGLSILVGYLMPNLSSVYFALLSNIEWLINLCGLFNAKSILYFSLVSLLHGISTFVDYLMQNLSLQKYSSSTI